MQCVCGKQFPEGRERLDDGEFYYFPHRIGNHTLIFGRKNSHFPYQLFVRTHGTCLHKKCECNILWTGRTRLAVHGSNLRFGYNANSVLYNQRGEPLGRWSCCRCHTHMCSNTRVRLLISLATNLLIFTLQVYLLIHARRFFSSTACSDPGIAFEDPFDVEKAPHLLECSRCHSRRPTR